MRIAVGVFLISGLIIIFLLFSRSDANFVDSSDSIMAVVPERESEFLWNKLALSDPSLIDNFGKPLTVIVPYINAVNRFPSLQSCLLSRVTMNHQLNTVQVRWHDIRSVPDFDVCVFRIASALQDAQRMLEWARASGFEAKLYPPNSIVNDGLALYGSWPRTKHGSLTPFPRPILQDWIERAVLARKSQFNFTIFFDRSGLPINVKSGIPIK